MFILADDNGGLGGLVFAGVGGLFVAIGAGMAIVQARRLKNYLPVPAVVLDTEVTSHSGSKGGRTYGPKVTYEYKTPSGPRKSSKTLALEYSSSNRSWAERIIARYPTGSATLAYIDPGDDDNVFLVHETAFVPYIFILFPMIFFSIGVGGALKGFGPSGWTDADRLLAVAILWHIVGLCCLTHYRRAGGKLTFGPLLAFAVYVGAGLIALGVWDNQRRQPPPPPKPVPQVKRPKSRPPVKPQLPLEKE